MNAQDVMDTLIMLMFVASIISTFVTTVQGVNTTSWSFTGASGAGTIWNLLPFIFISAFVMGLVAKLLYGRTAIGAWLSKLIYKIRIYAWIP